MTRLSVVLLAAVLVGCASAPPAPSAAVLTPAAWNAALPAGAAPWNLPAWWRAFDDPVMNPIVEAALAASPSLAVAAARVERAKASRVAAASASLPRVQAEVSVQQGRASVGTPVAASTQAGLQASWEIDLFGGRAAGERAAQARVSSAVAQAQGVRAAVAAEAAASVVALRSCQALAVQAADEARSRDETARLTALTARAGFSAPADAALARASAAQARALAQAQQASCESLVKSLVELTAWTEAELRQRWALASATADVPQPRAMAMSQVPADLLQQRPDLIDAAQAVIAAAGEHEVAGAALRPQLLLTGSVAAGSARSAGVSIDGSTWSIGPLTLSLPIFDGGARRANVAAARAEYDAAVRQYQGQLRRAVREVEQALVALASTGARADDARIADEGFGAALKATESRHRGGLASQFELEDARRNAAAARRALIGLQQERANAWIDLARALGGGWQP